MMFIPTPSRHRFTTLGTCLAVALWLAGCASGPGKGGSGVGKPPSSTTISPGRDGPPDRPPADLMQVPDAVPKLEPIVPGGPNKPYVIEGQAYEPIASDVTFKQRGLASWYGAKFHGRRTASGEIYSMYGMTAAHRTLPIPSYARVRSLATGKSVIVRINDRGPFHSSRVMDLSYTAAAKLDVLGRGTGEVEIERLTFDQIRTGQWRTDQDMAKAGGMVQAGGDMTPPADPIYALASRLEGARPQAVSQPEAVVAPLPATQSVQAASVAPASAAAVYPASEPATAALPAASSMPTTPVMPVLPLDAKAIAPAVLPAARPAPEGKAYAYTPAAKGYWVQLAAFSKRQGVDAFQQRVAQELSQLAPLLAVFNEASLYKLQIGPYERRDEAQSVAQRIRDALQLVPMVVERR